MEMRGIASVGLTVLLLAPALLPAASDPPQAKGTAENKNRCLFERWQEYKPAPGADELAKLLFERVEVANMEVRHLTLVITESGMAYSRRVVKAVKRLVDAELEVVTKREDRLAILEGHVEFLKRAELETRKYHLAGGA